MDGDRLKGALDRLDQAILRLGQAVDARVAQDAASPDVDSDRQALEAALAEAREGERRAREQAAEVSARLDQAIDRLRVVLED